MPLDRLAAMFKALSHPQRLKIIQKLCGCCAPGAACTTRADGLRCCAGDLGADLGLAASTVSHHLKELRQCGIMEVQRCGQRVECWINPAALGQLTAFLAGAVSMHPAATGGGHGRSKR
ncbi:MAG: helix-turn-helix transcriptional regulator [Deltaproteobacteria bacterium]|nr:helix-turn-helix transcriptional regulator [Deltaproteobacteria bacterium]